MAGRGHVGEGEEEAKANKDHHERREPEVAVVHEGSDLHHIVDDVLEASKLATRDRSGPRRGRPNSEAATSSRNEAIMLNLRSLVDT